MDFALTPAASSASLQGSSSALTLSQFIFSHKLSNGEALTWQQFSPTSGSDSKPRPFRFAREASRNETLGALGSVGPIALSRKFNQDNSLGSDSTTY